MPWRLLEEAARESTETVDLVMSAVRNNPIPGGCIVWSFSCQALSRLASMLWLQSVTLDNQERTHQRIQLLHLDLLVPRSAVGSSFLGHMELLPFFEL